MPTYSRVSDLGELEAPWGRIIQIQEVEYTGGAVMIRLRIREGRRITDLELTPDVAGDLGGKLVSWGAVQDREGTETASDKA